MSNSDDKRNNVPNVSDRSCSRKIGRHERAFLEFIAATITRIAALMAILLSVGAVSLHLAGVAAQRNYLSYFGIDPDGFPRASDWLMVQGYYSTLEQLFSALHDAGGTFVIALLVVSTVVVSIVRWRPGPQKESSLPFILGRIKLPSWLKLVLSSLMYSSWGIVSAYFILVLGLFLLILPALAGETAGRNAASRDAAVFGQGCSESRPCTELLADRIKIATGFVLTISLDHIAIYDTDKNLIRVIPREGVELSSPIPKKLLETDPEPG